VRALELGPERRTPPRPRDVSLSGLAPHTPYYFRLDATASGQTVQGTVQQFKTLSLPPVVPRLSKLRLVRHRFRASKHGGVKVTYRDTVAARTTFRVYRKRGAKWQKPIDYHYGDTYTTKLLPEFSLLIDPLA